MGSRGGIITVVAESVEYIVTPAVIVTFIALGWPHRSRPVRPARSVSP
jgi:hypothetical protein